MLGFLISETGHNLPGGRGIELVAGGRGIELVAGGRGIELVAGPDFRIYSHRCVYYTGLLN